MNKTFEFKVVAKFSTDKEIPEILKKPLRTLSVEAHSELDAVEKVWQEMKNTTYKQFFPELNDRFDDSWFTSWRVQHLFPQNITYENGEKIISEWDKKDIIRMSESHITLDIFERVEIKLAK